MTTTNPANPAAGLGDYLTTAQIIPELRAKNRWEAIDELMANLVATGKFQPEQRDAVTAAVRKRELSMSTGIGSGLGLPHAATDQANEVVAALGRAPAGIDFEALDGQPVYLVILLLIPQGQFQKHLHTVSSIAKLMHRAELREALKQAPDAEGILQLIRNQPAV